MSNPSEIVVTFQLYVDDIWLYLKQWDPLFAKYIETKGLMEDVCQKLRNIQPLTDAMTIYKMIKYSSFHTDVLIIHHRNDMSAILCHLIYKCVYPFHESEIHPIERTRWSSQKYWKNKVLYDTLRQKVLSSDSYDVESIDYNLIQINSIENGHEINEMSWDYSN